MTAAETAALLRVPLVDTTFRARLLRQGLSNDEIAEYVDLVEKEREQAADALEASERARQEAEDNENSAADDAMAHFAARIAAEAEVARLRAALEQISAFSERHPPHKTTCGRIARAALDAGAAPYKEPDEDLYREVQP